MVPAVSLMDTQYKRKAHIIELDCLFILFPTKYSPGHSFVDVVVSAFFLCGPSHSMSEAFSKVIGCLPQSHLYTPEDSASDGQNKWLHPSSLQRFAGKIREVSHICIWFFHDTRGHRVEVSQGILARRGRKTIGISYMLFIDQENEKHLGQKGQPEVIGTAQDIK